MHPLRLSRSGDMIAFFFQKILRRSGRRYFLLTAKRAGDTID
jgi:hypothetical protein